MIVDDDSYQSECGSIGNHSVDNTGERTVAEEESIMTTLQ